jgi:hypothetical protein
MRKRGHVNRDVPGQQRLCLASVRTAVSQPGDDQGSVDDQRHRRSSSRHPRMRSRGSVEALAALRARIRAIRTSASRTVMEVLIASLRS